MYKLCVMILYNFFLFIFNYFKNIIQYKEYEWILKEEVKNVLSEVEGLLNVSFYSY